MLQNSETMVGKTIVKVVTGSADEPVVTESSASTNESAGSNAGTAGTGTAMAGGTSTGMTGGTAVVGRPTGGVPAAAIGVWSGGATLPPAPTGNIFDALGGVVVGATHTPDLVTNTYTFDCWKSVVHDTSAEPSNGMLLREVIADPRIKKAITAAADGPLPQLTLVNVWDEEFRLDYVTLPRDQLAAHAVRVQ